MLDDNSMRPAQLSPSPRIKDLSGEMRASFGSDIWLKNKVSIFLISSKRLLKSPKLSVVEQPMTRRKVKRDRSFFFSLSLIENELLHKI